jgi:hypothetical protein
MPALTDRCAVSASKAPARTALSTEVPACSSSGGELLPDVVVEQDRGLGLVVVLDRAAARGALDQFDQAQVGEDAHVVADDAERGVEAAGELHRTGPIHLDRAEDLNTQRVVERLDDAGIGDVCRGLHVLVLGERWMDGKCVPDRKDPIRRLDRPVPGKLLLLAPAAGVKSVENTP